MKVFVSRVLPGDAIERIARAHEVVLWEEDSPVPAERLLSEARVVDGLLVTLNDRVSADLFAAAPRLRAVSNVAVGYDNIDVAAATAYGVAVCNTPGVLTEATADLAFGLLIAAARRFREADRLLRENRWRDWSPSLLLGSSVFGGTLGIVGLGAIGSAVARRASGFNMKVVYTGHRHVDREVELGVDWRCLEDLLAESDFVSLHVPLSAETHHLIGADRLALMKRNAILVNTSRGAIVDQFALANALRTGTIAGAGLDVFESEPLPANDPLREIDSAILLPHVGSATAAARVGMATLAADNLIAVLDGRPPRNCVNRQVLDS